MNSGDWHARIECGGKVAGAGFLVTQRKVLTCAHVVRHSDQAPLTVSFPQRPGMAAIPARVVDHGGWAGGATDPGDLAVLELAEDVAIDPATLVGAEVAYDDPPPRLIAYGFPSGYDEGVLAEYRATAAQLISGEWIQLEAWQAHGQPLAPGFSGAAVALSDTGKVVGMVTASAGRRDVRTGRMMPTHVMALYWPELSALIPTPCHTDADRARLRELVEKAARTRLHCDPLRLYTEAAGPCGPPAPPEGFTSLWSAAWYVQCEVEDQSAVTRFADRLDALLNAPAASATAPQGSGSFTVEPPPAPDWSPITVELAHSGAGDDQVVVKVSAHCGEFSLLVGAGTVPQDQLRTYVQNLIDAAFHHLKPGADELIAFVLPRDWIDWPVDLWETGPYDTTPLGCTYPLVVTDHARRRGGVRHTLTRAWKRLDSERGIRLDRVECHGAGDPKGLRRRLRGPDASLAGFATGPSTSRIRAHFETSLTAPAPMIVWLRGDCCSALDGTCPAGDGADRGGGASCSCRSFLDRLEESVARVPPAELPRHILALREQADEENDADSRWARDIQLLWDDPRCLPAPLDADAPVRPPVA
ncbi:VMAP-C domain-containing protein [Streptomyces chartreusis]|uniref:VMAP-C domain-containing protein n=1 Tax=Streptomyces chartreusis TaxID=1969 RepID=UPI00364AD7D7